MARSDQKKEAALKALIDSSTLTEAAEKAGISRRTMYGYLHNDYEFANKYKELCNAQTISFLEDLNSTREQASAVIKGIMEDEKQPAAVRLKAAQIILSAAADQEKAVSSITKENIKENESIFDTLKI